MQDLLLVIDALNFIRRIYKANPDPDSDEKAKLVMVNVMHSFKRALREHQPTYCVWVFDAGGPTWRHHLYSDYKKNREEMAPALQRGIAEFKDTLSMLGWACVTKPEVEADDTIASLNRVMQHRHPGVKVRVLSTDKDLACLLAQGAELHDHFAREARSREWCLQKFGVPPELLPDFLALTGDATDNIPGIEGIGGVTAAKLLNAYGDLDGVLAQAPTLKGKVGASLASQPDKARLCQALTRLKQDVPLERLALAELALGLVT